MNCRFTPLFEIIRYCSDGSASTGTLAPSRLLRGPGLALGKDALPHPTYYRRRLKQLCEPESRNLNALQLCTKLTYAINYASVMKINLQTFTNESIATLSFTPDEKVASLLDKFEAASKVPVGDQRLVMFGNMLETGDPIGESTISDFLRVKFDAPFTNEYDHCPKVNPTSIKGNPAPLDFVIVDGLASSNVLRMEAATTTTAIQEIVQWISSERTDAEWDAVAFYFGEFGKSFYFPRNEKLCDVAENVHWKFAISDYLCWDKPVPVSFKTFGWGTGNKDAKTTFPVKVDYGPYYRPNSVPNSVFMKTLTARCC